MNNKVEKIIFETFKLVTFPFSMEELKNLLIKESSNEESKTNPIQCFSCQKNSIIYRIKINTQTETCQSIEIYNKKTP